VITSDQDVRAGSRSCRGGPSTAPTLAVPGAGRPSTGEPGSGDMDGGAVGNATRARWRQQAVPRVRPLRGRVTPSDRLEPVEAHHCAGHQHEREPPSRIPVPAHLQPPEATQPRQRVGSDRGAVPSFPMVRFPGPHLRTGRASSPASGSPQALVVGLLLIRSPSTAWGSARPGSGSGSPSPAHSAAAPSCRASATTWAGSGDAATPSSPWDACGAAI
jgi:hypothetical protein